MARTTDFSGRSEYPTTLRTKVPNSGASDTSPAGMVWREINAKGKQSKLTKGTTGIHTRQSGVASKWRAVNNVVQDFVKHGVYNPGSGITAVTSPQQAQRKETQVSAAFARAAVDEVHKNRDKYIGPITSHEPDRTVETQKKLEFSDDDTIRRRVEERLRKAREAAGLRPSKSPH